MHLNDGWCDGDDGVSCARRGARRARRALGAEGALDIERVLPVCASEMHDNAKVADEMAARNAAEDTARVAAAKAAKEKARLATEAKAASKEVHSVERSAKISTSLRRAQRQGW